MDGEEHSSHRKLSPGEFIVGLKTVAPLGQGRQASVWHVRSGGVEPESAGSTAPEFALKVYRSGDKRIAPYLNEISILKRLGRHENIIGCRGMIVDIHFDSHGLSHLHPCVVFDFGGQSLHSLILHHTETTDRGIPLGKSKQIIRQIFKGLSFLHEAGVTHTDIKPENVLVSGELPNVRLADFDGAIFDGKITHKYPGTRQYMAPELIINSPYDHTIDIWAALATAYEVVTGDLMFDIFDEYSIQYGIEDTTTASSADESGAAVSDESEVTSGDESSIESIDEDESAYQHLLLIARVIGFPPESFVAIADPDYYEDGRPRRHRDVEPISIFDLLMLNYDLPAEVSQGFHEFLAAGLKYLPAERISAKAAAEHEWLM